MIDWFRKESVKKDFQETLLEHIDSLHNAALSMTRSKQDAEDLVQETSLRAYRNFDKFKPGTNFKAWTMTILRNIYINRYRKKMREPRTVSLEEVGDCLAATESSGVQEERAVEDVRALVEKLPEELRTTLTLFYAEGLSYKEIAGVMDIPIGTVMSRIHTARQMLRKRLAGSIENGDWRR